MNQKVNSELHTVASTELQAEIDKTLKKLEEQDKEKKSEGTVEYDGDGSNRPDPKSK